jgi:hypothetical protein
MIAQSSVTREACSDNDPYCSRAIRMAGHHVMKSGKNDLRRER